MLTGDNGILTRAGEAKEKTDITQIDEQRRLATMVAATNLTETEFQGVKIPAGFAPTMIEGESTKEEGLVITDSTGNEFVWIEVPNDGTGPNYSNVEKNAEGKVEFTEENYTAIKNALISYAGFPEGSDMNTTRKNWKDVWYDSNWNNEGDNPNDTEGCGLTLAEYKQLYKKMLESIYTNGGFWIGRYETGIKGSESAPTGVRNSTQNNEILSTDGDIPVIKANVQSYTWVRCSQAQRLASNMNSGNYSSSLMFGLQWDLVIKYLQANGTEENALKENSTSWGNYQDTLYNITDIQASYSTDSGATWLKAPYNKMVNGMTLLTTGANEEFKKQNIYDLAGNVFEFTLEYASSGAHTKCALRGGCSGIRGIYGTASNRFVPSTMSSAVYRF